MSPTTLNYATTLYRARRRALVLTEALAAAAPALSVDGQETCLLVYTPRRCSMASIDGSGVVREPIEMAGAFEARAFSGRGEVRWLRQDVGAGTGDAVLVSPDRAPRVLGFEMLPPLENLAPVPRIYLLWGQAERDENGSATAGATRLYEAAIGTLTVPVGSAGSDGRVRLHATEWLRRQAPHGNVVVAEELLIGFGDEA